MAGRCKQGGRLAANDFLVLLGLCIGVAGMHQLHDLSRSNGVGGFCHMSKQWQVGQAHHQLKRTGVDEVTNEHAGCVAKRCVGRRHASSQRGQVDYIVMK